jgi:hypothetical protein
MIKLVRCSGLHNFLSPVNHTSFRAADAMAGPKADRETKFIKITGDVLKIAKECKDKLAVVQLVTLGLADKQLSAQMEDFSLVSSSVL